MEIEIDFELPKYIYHLPEEDYKDTFLLALERAKVDDPFGVDVMLAFCPNDELEYSTFTVDTFADEAKLYKFMKTFALHVADMVGATLPPFNVVCTNPQPYTYMVVDGMTLEMVALYNENIRAANITFMEDTGLPHPNLFILTLPRIDY